MTGSLGLAVCSLFLTAISSLRHVPPTSGLANRCLRLANEGSVVPSPVTSSGSSLAIETDYMGMVNFCLRTTDTALSRSSRSKVLNTVTNDVFKAIMIGDESLIETTLKKFESYGELVDSSECILSSEDGEMSSPEAYSIGCTRDALTARIYIDWLFKLFTHGITQDDTVLGGIYDRGYKRLLTTLRNAGCVFKSDGTRPAPQDSNICLSVLDLKFPSNQPSKTKELNHISNCVARAMLYGGTRERRELASSLRSRSQGFASRWRLEGLSQELVYLEALSVLLEEGVEVAASAVSSSACEGVFGVSNVTGSINAIPELMHQHSLRLFDTYLNAFQRVLEKCLNEMGTRGNLIPQNDDVLNNFVNWEQSVRR